MSEMKSKSIDHSFLFEKSKELAFNVSECISEKNMTLPDKFVQFRDTAISIFSDVSDGIKQKPEETVLFLFSKAKSSCLVMEDILQKIWFSLPEGSSLSFLLKLIEIKTILKQHIEIIQINQVALKKQSLITSK